MTLNLWRMIDVDVPVFRSASGSVYFFGPPGSASGSISQKKGSEDPDPYQSKISRIRNTGFKITCWRITSGIRTGRRFRGGFCLVRYILEKIHLLKLFSFNGWSQFHSFLTRLLMEFRGFAPFMYTWVALHLLRFAMYTIRLGLQVPGMSFRRNLKYPRRRKCRNKFLPS